MSVDFGDINYLAVIVAAMASLALGTGWYGLFAKPWMEEMGMTPEMASERAAVGARGYVAVGVSWLIAALALSMLVQLTRANGVVDGLWLGLIMGIGLLAASQVPHFSFEVKSLRLFMIDKGYPVTALAVAGIILGVWQ
jgi:hypothetical protein